MPALVLCHFWDTVATERIAIVDFEVIGNNAGT